MKRILMSVLAAAVGAVLVGGSASFAADKDTNGSATKTQTVKKPVGPAGVAADKSASDSSKSGETKSRLPNGYGKLNLTDKQRTEVLAVQQNFNKQIHELESRIVELKHRRDAESRAVLTQEQQNSLAAAQKSAGEGDTVKPGEQNATGKAAPTPARRRRLRKTAPDAT